jgi:hypothetical protein
MTQVPQRLCLSPRMRPFLPQFQSLRNGPWTKPEKFPKRVSDRPDGLRRRTVLQNTLTSTFQNGTKSTIPLIPQNLTNAKRQRRKTSTQAETIAVPLLSSRGATNPFCRQNDMNISGLIASFLSLSSSELICNGATCYCQVTPSKPITTSQTTPHQTSSSTDEMCSVWRARWWRSTCKTGDASTAGNLCHRT